MMAALGKPRDLSPVSLRQPPRQLLPDHPLTTLKTTIPQVIERHFGIGFPTGLTSPASGQVVRLGQAGAATA